MPRIPPTYPLTNLLIEFWAIQDFRKECQAILSPASMECTIQEIVRQGKVLSALIAIRNLNGHNLDNSHV